MANCAYDVATRNQ